MDYSELNKEQKALIDRLEGAISEAALFEEDRRSFNHRLVLALLFLMNKYKKVKA